ncbi:MAG: hypothetical protein Q6358_01540 [Candidatus Brocadiales bacterium]|nr:hypothetical protein [Candidatus Brocadiales bacterium]
MQNAFIHFDIYFRRNFDSIKVVPSNIIVSWFKFQQAAMFELELPEKEKKPSKISFA